MSIVPPMNDPTVALTGRQLDLQKAVESYLQAKAQSLLDGVIGPSRSIVRVNAQLNFEKVERTIEEYDPNNLAIVSQEKLEETTTDNSNTSEGGSSGSETRKDNTIVNYEVNKTVQHIIEETGNIEKLSVSVIVDGKYGANPETGETVYSTRSPEEISQLSTAVRNAVGVDDDRQDSFEMVSVQFDRQYFQQEQEQLDQLEQRQFLMDVGVKALQIFGIIIGLLILRRYWRKLVNTIKSWVPPAPRQPAPAHVRSSGGDEEKPEPIEPEQRKARLTDQMTTVAKEKPDEIAKVIRTMMIE
jgi:flagellar M-ring protein FliF